MTVRATIDRFITKVEWPFTLTACWPWKSTTNQYGYGTFCLQGAKRLAHRASYELFRGPIPDGLTLDHLCRVRSCVNPLHLEAVSGVVNTMRGEGPPAINARKTHCPKGHSYGEQNPYPRRDGRRRCRTCNAAAVRRYKARKKAASC